MKKSKKVTLLVAIFMATAFTFSCSSDDSSDPAPAQSSTGGTSSPSDGGSSSSGGGNSSSDGSSSSSGGGNSSSDGSSSSSNGNSSSNSGGGGYIDVACSWNYGSTWVYGTGRMCMKIYEYPENFNTDCNVDGNGGQSVESCPNNQDKTCLMIASVEGMEFDMDVFLYGELSSRSCEDWAAVMGIPSRLRENGSSSSSGGISNDHGHFNPDITYGSLTDPRDNKTYRTVKIGTQTWMAENLNYDVPDNTTDVCYNNDPVNCATYGRLYNWATAMANSASSSATPSGVQGVCPPDWHLPSNTEWDQLYRFADGTTGTSSPYSSPTAGRHLKAQSGWSNCSPSGSSYVCSDTYGFSALPGGGCYGTGFFDAGYNGYWWSSSEDSSNIAYNRRMYYGDDNANRAYDYKSSLFSVRCLHD